MGIKYLKQEEINELRERASGVRNHIKVIDVLDQCGVKYRQAGATYFFTCPDCGHDNAATSNAKPHLWHCFGGHDKGGKGTGLSLLASLTGRPYGEVVAEEGCAYGLITADEYDFLMRLSTGKNGGTAPIPVAKKPTESKVTHTRLNNPKVLNFVYSNMLKMEEFQLTPDTIEYLKSRKVTDFRDFFCYHASFDVAELTKRLKAIMPNFTENYYYGVPGFYLKDNVWKFVGRQADAVGLIIRNSVGQIVGLQTRNIKKAGQRYYWVSSIPKNEQEGCDYGSSPGAPCHFVYPDRIKSGKYILTEGVFKVRHLVELYGGIGISLQGVTNSKSVSDEIKASWSSEALLSRLPKDEKLEMSLNFFFDSDILFKQQACDAVITAYQRVKDVKQDLPAYFHLWTLMDGKGFDDLVLAHPQDWQQRVKIVEAEDFVARVEGARESVKRKMGIEHLSFTEISHDKKLKYEYSKGVYQTFWMELTYH